MSGLRPIELTEFYRSLHARGESTESLAVAVHLSAPVLRKMIVLLKPRRGRPWTAFLDRLTERERELILTVEQRSTWRARQEAKRPHWTAEKVAGLAETYYGKFDAERDRLRAKEAS